MFARNRSPFASHARKTLAAALGAVGLLAADSMACSDVLVPPDRLTGQVVSARTLDFPLVDQTIITEVTLQAYERHRVWHSDWQGLGNGKEWRNKYGFVGMNALKSITKLLDGRVVNMDGMNETGFSAAFLWLEAADYPEAIPKVASQSLSFFDAVNYFLGNFATVAEVKSALTNQADAGYVQIWGPPLFRYVPLHVVVRDATGKSLIIEWTGKSQQIYDGPMVDDIGGILTNDPPYPEQLANLRQQKYNDATPEEGMFPIPGDSTMQGRFVRLAKLRQYAGMARGDSPADAVQVAAHLINNVDVVYGTNREDIAVDDYTGPVLIRDHRNRILYFKGNNNQSYRKIVIKDVDFTRPHGAGILADPLPTDPIYARYEFGQDVTAMLNATAQQQGSTGPVDAVSLTIVVSEPVHSRHNGGMYIYALTPDRKAWQWAFGRWSPVSALDILLPVYRGPLEASKTFHVHTASLPGGTEIYVGYGLSGLEMLLQQRQTMAYVVPAPEQQARRALAPGR